jgi:Bacterial SH3 domain
MTRQILAAVVAGLLALGAAPSALAQLAPVERLKVTDPYLEMHTGPGRGYPVFHVAAREEWVEITLRHTDWYQVRTDKGQLGWVHRSQLASTLTAAGVARSLRDLALDDYLKRRLEFGAAVGRFKSEPMLKVWTAYKLSEAFSVEGTLGQVQGLFSGTDYWHLNLHTEPWADQRLSPTFGIGFGRLRNFPNASLVGAQTTHANLANMTLGLRWHLSDRFVARADYTLHTAFVSSVRTGEYRAVSAGLAFFF